MRRDKDPEEAIEKITPLLVELQTDLDGRLNLDGLAERCGYSSSHFHRFFAKTLGETPGRYVERLRMEKAAYKPWITDESVLDVALSTGFKNHETFSRACRRYFRISPRGKLADTVHAAELYAIPSEPSGAISIRPLTGDGVGPFPPETP